MLQPFREPQETDDLFQVGFVAIAILSSDVECNIYVHACAERRQQIEFLEYEANPTLAHARALGIGQLGEISTIKDYPTGICARQTSQHIEQRRFSAA